MDIEIMVEGEGLADVESVKIPEGSPAREIVAAVAAKGGFRVEEGLLFVEDVEGPIDLAAVIVAESVRSTVHHVHRARMIEVTVFYQDREIGKRFPPSARVLRVLDWAVSPEGFNIDSAIAPEMELALHGQTKPLPKNAHIGRYVKHPHDEVAFDLIRGVVPNGDVSLNSSPGVKEAVASDLASARFRAGVIRGYWRQVSYEFPVLILAVAAVEPSGSSSEYCFRFELADYPGTAPEVKIWDCAQNTVLPKEKRPKGSGRVIKAFQVWGANTVYRPWDRQSAGHNNFARDFPDLAWHPRRDLSFILEDLYGLLTSNAVACGSRPAA